MPSIARKLRLAVPAAAIALAAIAPGAANAGALAASASNCDSQTLGQTFLPWADVANYTLNPGGSFEPGSAPWTLNGASIVSGNESADVGSPTDANSLSIPAGASATSAVICVGIGHPDIRFFARGSSPTATLNVQVLYVDGSGNTQTLPIGSAVGGSDWAPVAPMPIIANLFPVLPDGMTPVQFTFTASGGSFQIDDLYVDPYRYG